MAPPPLVKSWIVIGTLASAAGWILSALGQLNLAGYTIFAILSLAAFFLLRGKTLFARKSFNPGCLRRRFSHPLPLAFAGLTLLIFLGGALYNPSNYDGLTYRLPRILHWLAEGQWHWIHTNNYRMNDRTCGFEWLMTPVVLITRSDRALFLINFIPFLLLPGLIFSVFTRLGIAPRVAWQWMWLLPTGYNFLLQAGSVGNDTFAAVYVLAAMDFALRARVSQRITDVWFSLLAVALMTGAKPGNLPLLLPWTIAFFPVARILFSRPILTLFMVLTALGVSFIPTAILNVLHCGDWTGLSLEASTIAMKHPLVGIAGNGAMIFISNAAPTFFPLAGWWNQHALTLLPPSLGALLAANFEGNFYKLGEMPIEEQAGLGFGLTWLLIIYAWTRLKKGGIRAWSFVRSPQRAIMTAAYISLLFFFAKSGMESVSRLVSAYYPLLVPLFLTGPTAIALVRKRWWRYTTGVVLALSFAVVVVTPARPLWPARTVIAQLPPRLANRSVVERFKNVYLGYATRPDVLAEARSALPDSCRIVGIVADGNDSEISLWRPFGQRKVEDILLNESPESIHERGIQYAVISELYLDIQHQTLEGWLQQHPGQVIKKFTATMIIRNGPQNWYVVKFKSPAAT